MLRLSKRMWHLLSLALIALAIAPMALAQETTAGIHGTVISIGHPVRARRTRRAIAVRQHLRQRDNRLPDRWRQRLRKRLHGGWRQHHEHPERRRRKRLPDGVRPGSSGEDEQLRGGV